jgi:hypothetical protein
MYHGHGNYFGHTRWYSYVTWVRWKLVSVHLEIVLVLVQDKCMVCAECTMGIEIILGTPDCTYRGVKTVASMLFELVSEYGSLVAWVDS